MHITHEYLKSIGFSFYERTGRRGVFESVMYSKYIINNNVFIQNKPLTKFWIIKGTDLPKNTPIKRYIDDGVITKSGDVIVIKRYEVEHIEDLLHILNNIDFNYNGKLININ